MDPNRSIISTQMQLLQPECHSEEEDNQSSLSEKHKPKRINNKRVQSKLKKISKSLRLIKKFIS